MAKTMTHDNLRLKFASARQRTESYIKNAFNAAKDWSGPAKGAAIGGISTGLVTLPNLPRSWVFYTLGAGIAVAGAVIGMVAGMTLSNPRGGSPRDNRPKDPTDFIL